MLAINEGLRLAAKMEELKKVEEEFSKMGITWSIPSYDEWKTYFQRHKFKVVSDTSPIPYRITLIELENFIKNPLAIIIFNHQGLQELLL